MPVAGLKIYAKIVCAQTLVNTHTICAECGFLLLLLIWTVIFEIFSGTKMLKFQNKKLANKAFDSTGSICLFDGV